MLSNAAPLKTRESAAGCLTRRLTTDIYCCVARNSGCSHALSFGYEYLCQHPNRAAYDLEPTGEQSRSSLPLTTPGENSDH